MTNVDIDTTAKAELIASNQTHDIDQWLYAIYPESALFNMEQSIFNAADKYLDTYSHGMWTLDIYELNGEHFCIWTPPAENPDAPMTLHTESGHGDIKTTARAAGWALTMIVTNHLLWALSEMPETPRRNRMIEVFNNLWWVMDASYPDTLSEPEVRDVWTFLD